MKYSISVVCHNALEYTKKCIDSVFRNSEDFELLVTDNASTDGTKEYLRSFYAESRMKVISSDKNLGFIRPQNFASKMAQGKYFVVLNNDVEVPPRWLEAMEKKFQEDPKVAIVGPRGTCSTLNAEGSGCLGNALEYIEGSCLMIPMELVNKHGLFSDDFVFAYCEDADLSLRFRQLGYKIALADIQVLHVRAVTSQIAQKEIDVEGYRIRNHWVFREKWKRYLERREFSSRALVIRMAAIGDVLLVTPVLKTLRQKHPGAEITVVSIFPEVFRGNPNVQKVLGANDARPKDDHYDWVYNLDLAYEKDPKKHIVQAYAQACGVTAPDYIPEVFPSQAEEQWTAAIKVSPYAVIHTGATGWLGRNWPVDRFQKVCDHLQSKGISVFLVGNEATPPITCVADLRRQTPLHTLYSVIKRAVLFVGIDSLPMHLAVAAGTPLVAVFGCISPEYRLPDNPKFRGITAKGLACLGCHHYLPSPRTCTQFCLRGDPLCMKKLEVEQVIEAADILLKENKR